MALFLSGCSHNISNELPEELSDKVVNEQSSVEENTEIIIGSSNINNPHKHKSRTYFLYGAEHLKLDNYYFDIPIVFNKSVKMWMHYFLNRGRGFFERYSARAGRYAPILGKILEDHGLPRDLIFLAMAESGFHNKAKSWAKAVGPWQFMPYTGRRYGLKIDWYIDERRDPLKATIAASKYLKKLYKDFNSWELAAAAYNAGEGKMSRAIKRYKTENFWSLRNGRYLKRETKNYVPKIMALAIIGKNLKAFGFEDIDFHEQLDFEEIEVESSSDLQLIASNLNIELEELYRLNPEILRWYTPPKINNYKLRIPVGSKVNWQRIIDSGISLKASQYQDYAIRGNRSTLNDVARKFKIKSYVLENLNSIKSGKKLNRGQKIILPFKVGQSRFAEMYNDLYEKPRKSITRRRTYKRLVRSAKKSGKKIQNGDSYTVRRGDTLWDVARKTKTPLNNLIVSNLNIINRRMIRAGDKLVVH